MKIWLVILPAFLLFLLWTGPLVLDPFNKIYSVYTGDSVSTLANRQNNRLDHFEELIKAITIPIAGGIFTYNLLIFIGYIFTFVSAYFLIKNVLKKQTSFSGLPYLFASIIVLAPIRQWYSFEWTELANTGFIVLGILYLAKFIRYKTYKFSPQAVDAPPRFVGMVVSQRLTRPLAEIVRFLKPAEGGNLQGAPTPLGGGGRHTDSVFTGLFIGLAFFNHAYQGIMLLFISFVVLSFTLARDLHLKISYSHRQTKAILEDLKKYIFLVLCTIIFLLPTVLSFIYPDITANPNARNVLTFSRSENDRWAFTARPWHYLIPDINNPILGNLAVKMHYKIWESRPYYLTEPFFPKEHTLFLGYTLMGLSLYTIYLSFLKNKLGTKTKNPFSADLLFFTRFFLATGIVSFVFSLPPYVAFNEFRIYFPSHFIYNFMPQFRTYARFGIFVFISNAVLATIALNHIYYKLKPTLKRNLFIVGFCTLIFIEFTNFPPYPSITTTPTKPYQWILSKQDSFGYLEIPPRVDYSDQLYTLDNNNLILNPYLLTLSSIREIENSLWNIEFSKPDTLWCNNFRELNGQYIMYHEKELNKDKVVKEFIATGNVTKELKVAMAESWGSPVWGNHVEKTENDIFKNNRELNMKNLLLSDPKFTLIKEFTNKEITMDRHNNNFSADKFDAVSIFQINNEYCDNIVKQ